MKPLSATVVLSLFTPSFRRSTASSGMIIAVLLTKESNIGHLTKMKDILHVVWLRCSGLPSVLRHSSMDATTGDNHYAN